VGRIVVWVEAAADVSTAMISSLTPHEPIAASPTTPRTSSECSGFASPMPSVPTPAYACAATVTTT
jgi:hypothetical protein